ncbi:hypothetical protein ACWD4B_31270 [Streptomyces sp. NPDC002536]
MSEISALWRVAPASEANWPAELCQDDGLTGYPPSGMPDAAWVLHAMYEHEQLPTSVSHHQAHQFRLADGTVELDAIGSIDLEVGIVTGGELGRAEHPGPGWRRLRWAELAHRTGEPVVAQGLLPSYRSAPDGRLEDGSWPVSLHLPAEGSLDRPSWNRLTDLLLEHSPAGPDTRCLAYYNPLVHHPRATTAEEFARHFAHRHVLTGRLGDAPALYDIDEPDFSPSNLWPEDRSWIVYTDYDLWGTKVAGHPSLIDALVGDAEIEARRLPWAC